MSRRSLSGCFATERQHGPAPMTLAQRVTLPSVGNTLTATCGHVTKVLIPAMVPTTMPRRRCRNATNTPVATCQNCHGDLTSWTQGNLRITVHRVHTTGKHATAAWPPAMMSFLLTNSGGLISGASCIPCHNTDLDRVVLDRLPHRGRRRTN